MTWLHMLEEAARNVEFAHNRGSTAYLAGWEHLAIREAASATEAQRAATTEIGAVHESAARKGTPKGPPESNQ